MVNIEPFSDWFHDMVEHGYPFMMVNIESLVMVTTEGGTMANETRKTSKDYIFTDMSLSKNGVAL